jgi:hypothetical protein
VKSSKKAMWGQTGGPTGGYGLVGSLLGQVKFVIVAVTDPHIYVFRRGLLARPSIKELMAKYRLDMATPVSFRRGALKVGRDTYWVAALIAQSEAKELAKFAESRTERLAGAD